LSPAAPKFAEGSAWLLPDTATDLRWLEIHNVEHASTEALYHVSVLSRHKGDPVWNLKRLVAHMAITESALARSVSPRAARLRAAYPETYEEAYRSWLTLREKGSAPVCDTNVMECAHL
jgi:Domain of unknown function (DUF5086)